MNSSHSESSVTESDNHTARFEERSVLSLNTVDEEQRKADRIEAFKVALCSHAITCMNRNYVIMI